MAEEWDNVTEIVPTFRNPNQEQAGHSQQKSSELEAPRETKLISSEIALEKIKTSLGSSYLQKVNLNLSFIKMTIS